MGRKVTGSGTEVTIYGKRTQVTSYGITCAASSRVTYLACLGVAFPQ